MHPRLFDLTDAQALVRDTARSYAQKMLVPVAARLDREAAFPREQLAGLADGILLIVRLCRKLNSRF